MVESCAETCGLCVEGAGQSAEAALAQRTAALQAAELNFQARSGHLYVDDKSMLDLKALLANPDKRVVLVPSYQSILDLFVILYALYDNGIDLPFTFGPDEDAIQNLIKIGFVDNLLSKIGYIRTNFSRDDMAAYNLNTCLLRETINNNQLTMVFQ